jgi:hypothetical protein
MDKKIRIISVCDTIHDFGKDGLCDNIYYKNFLNENTRGFKERTEDNVLKYLKIPDIEPKSAVKKYNELDRNTIMSLAHEKNKNINFYIACKTYDVKDAKFNIFLSEIFNKMKKNNINLEFIADVSGLSYEVIDKLNISCKIIISEATAYDRLIENKSRSIIDKISIIPDTPLTKINGNLFGLEFLSIIHGNSIKYEYINNGINISKQFNINSYINGQKLAQSEAKNSLRPFLFNIIKKMEKRKKETKSNKKQKKENNIITSEDDILESRSHTKSKLESVKQYPLKKLLELIKTIYQLDYNDFGFYNEDIDGSPIIEYNLSSQLFVNILFDFKRAGDQLQIESAKKQNAIFLSGDRLAIAYAYAIGIPCIKPSNLSETDEDDENLKQVNDNKQKSKEKSKRKILTFYNISPDDIIDAIENRSYFNKIVGINLYKIEDYIQFILYLKELLNQSFSDDVIKNIKENILHTIKKSLKILQLDPTNINIQRVSKRTQKNEIYDYMFYHRYNIIIHILLSKIINDIIDSDILINKYLYFKNKFQQYYSTIKIDDVKDVMQSLNVEITNSDIYKYIDTLNFKIDDHNKDINKLYFRDLLNNYVKDIDEMKYLYNYDNPKYNIYSIISEYVKFDKYLEFHYNSYSNINIYTHLNELITKITTDMMSKYNYIISNIIMNDKLQIHCLQNYLALKNYVIKDIDKQKVYISCKYNYDENFQKYMESYIDTNQIEVDKLYLELNKFDITIGNLYQINTKISKIIRSIDTDMRDFKNILDMLYNLIQIDDKKDISFVDTYLLTRIKAPALHELMQFGGGKIKNLEEISDFDLFLDELNKIYDDNDKNTNDFTKILIAFIVKQFCIFDRNGNLNMIYLTSLSKSPLKSSIKISSKSSAKTFSKSQLKSSSKSSESAKLSAASTISPFTSKSLSHRHHKKSSV